LLSAIYEWLLGGFWRSDFNSYISGLWVIVACDFMVRVYEINHTRLIRVLVAMIVVGTVSAVRGRAALEIVAGTLISLGHESNTLSWTYIYEGPEAAFRLIQMTG
jgi:hypothetical protein